VFRTARVNLADYARLPCRQLRNRWQRSVVYRFASIADALHSAVSHILLASSPSMKQPRARHEKCHPLRESLAFDMSHFSTGWRMRRENKKTRGSSRRACFEKRAMPLAVSQIMTRAGIDRLTHRFIIVINYRTGGGG